MGREGLPDNIEQREDLGFSVSEHLSQRHTPPDLRTKNLRPSLSTKL